MSAEIGYIGIWIIEHEDEILAKIPPEKQPDTILAIAKMREGVDKLTKFLEEISKEDCYENRATF